MQLIRHLMSAIFSIVLLVLCMPLVSFRAHAGQANHPVTITQNNSILDNDDDVLADDEEWADDEDGAVDQDQQDQYSCPTPSDPAAGATAQDAPVTPAGRIIHEITVSGNTLVPT